ncbi:MAG: hypothetical protein ABSB42_17455 [Tepidisphaeraceae bacterium]|jgi:hypothetical protein
MGNPVFSALAETSGFGRDVLIALPFAIAAVVLLRMRWFFRKISGWDALAQRFPPMKIRALGAEYRVKGSCGRLRSGRGSGGKFFQIAFAQEGLLVTASFASESPILIPWSSIRQVSGADFGSWGGDVCVRVDYEKTLLFHFPKDALAVLQQNVPAERIQKFATSVGELLRNRMHQSSK